MSEYASGWDRGAYLLMLVPAAERARMVPYASELPRLQARFGGRFRVLAPAPFIEHFGHNGEAHNVMLSAFPSMSRLRDYWASPEHRRVAARCRAEDLPAVALDAEIGADDSGAQSLALFLGPGPSPALLEAAGARALALVRERAVVRLHGDWNHGDVALYGWTSATSARHSLLSFSSGQRGRGLLLPALPPARTESAARAAA